MRTAYISNPARPVASVPYMGSAVKIWLVGGTDVARNVFTSTLSQISDPNLSPLKGEVVFGWSKNIATDGTRVYRCDLDGGNLQVIAFYESWADGNLNVHPSWHPDGSKVAYIKWPLTFGDDLEIRSVDRDGTNDTLLHTFSGSLRHLSYSPSGDFLVFSSVSEIWVIDADGSNPTMVRDSPYANAFDEGRAPAWQNNADVIGFARYEDASNPILWQTVNPDGSGLATFFTSTDQKVWWHGSKAWLSDDSAMVGLKWISGISIFDGNAVARPVIVAADGSGVTEILGTGHDGTWKYQFIGICEDGGYEDGWSTTGIGPRIYVNKGAHTAVVSCLEDGSDVRTDDNPSDNTVFGFEWRGTL